MIHDCIGNDVTSGLWPITTSADEAGCERVCVRTSICLQDAKMDSDEPEGITFA